MRKEWQTGASDREYLKGNSFSFCYYSDLFLFGAMGIIGILTWYLLQKNVVISVFFTTIFIVFLLISVAYIKIRKNDKKRLSAQVRKDRAYRHFMNDLEHRPKEEQQEMLLEKWTELLKLKQMKKVKGGYEGLWQEKEILLCSKMSVLKKSYDAVFVLQENETTDFLKKQIPIVLLKEQDFYRLWEKEEDVIFCTAIDKSTWEKGLQYGAVLFLWAVIWKSKGAMVCAMVCFCLYGTTVVKKYKNNRYFSLKKLSK